MAYMITKILAPTFGIVESVVDEIICIYIDVSDNHSIYAPIDGIVSEIKTFDGLVSERKGNTIFTSQKNRRGHVRFSIDSRIPRLYFRVEVGKGYVTDRIRYWVSVGDLINAGQIIGEIILGSRSMIHVPAGSEVLVNKGRDLIGGETPIASYKE